MFTSSEDPRPRRANGRYLHASVRTLFVAATVVTVVAASARSAQAQQTQGVLVINGNSDKCIGAPGGPPVVKDLKGIHFEYPNTGDVICSDASPTVLDISQFTVFVYWTNPSVPLTCEINAFRGDASPIFESPIVRNAPTLGLTRIDVEIPFSNDARVVQVKCSLPLAPNPSNPNALTSIFVYTRN
jgi:hypothetical protein